MTTRERSKPTPENSATEIKSVVVSVFAAVAGSTFVAAVMWNPLGKPKAIL
jgi:hypothetical protein